MTVPTLEERFREVLRAQGGFAGFYRLAETLRDEGHSQDEVRALFNSFMAEHQGNADETLYDSIVDVLDFIVGFCAPGHEMFKRAGQQHDPMPIDDLIALMEGFVSGDAISLADAEKLEGLLREWAPEHPELEDLADDLAQYRPTSFPFLHDYSYMKPRVAHRLAVLRARLADLQSKRRGRDLP